MLITPGKPSLNRVVAGAPSEPTIYEMSIASGMSSADACEFAKGMDPFGCRTRAQLRLAARPTPFQRPAYAAPRLLDADCYDHTTYSGDGSKHAHACYTRYLDYRDSKIKLISAKMKTTGWSKDPGWVGDRIDEVGMQLRWASESSYAVDWTPNHTVTATRCKTVTTSVSSPKTGVSYGVSGDVCPDKLTAWHSPAYQNFGAKWKGQAAHEDEERGATASSVHKLGRYATQAVTIRSWLSWN